MSNKISLTALPLCLVLLLACAANRRAPALEKKAGC